MVEIECLSLKYEVIMQQSCPLGSCLSYLPCHKMGQAQQQELVDFAIHVNKGVGIFIGIVLNQ